jgi:phospholipid/cholesterol/gamma-HCH transport system permease protein
MKLAAVEKIEHLGGVVDLGRRMTMAMFRPPLMFGEVLKQIETIGVRSLPIVVMTAIFSSLVMTVQMGVQLSRFGSLEYVGSVVSLSMVRELGPVLTALLVGGRVGAGIAAELGSMAVTEQVDAIRSMGADPVKKLVVPRVIASVFALPLLTTLANVIGVLAAAIVSRFEYGIGIRYFLSSVSTSVKLSDFLGGVMKTVVFGFFLGLIACYEGLKTRGGTEGVGLSTTKTVVITSVVTLIIDFIMTSVLLSMGY